MADVTNNFGFKKYRDGGMIYGKDLNEFVEDLDDKLGQAMGLMSVDSYGATVSVGSAAWAAVIGMDPPEMIFGSQVELTKARFVVTAGLMGVNSIDLALAKASDPSTPITAFASFTGAGGEAVVAAVAGTVIDADEELTVIERDTAEVGLVGVTADIQAVAEGQKVTT